MTEVRIDDNCPDLDENYYEALSEHQEIDVENGPETEIEDDLSFMETDIDAPKEEKHQTKQIDMSWLMDIIKKDEQNKEKAEKELKARYTFDDMVSELIIEKINDSTKSLIPCIDFNMPTIFIKNIIGSITPEMKDMIVKQIKQLPKLPNGDFYPFCEYDFDVIPDFAKLDFIELYLEYRQRIIESCGQHCSAGYYMQHAVRILTAPLDILDEEDRQILSIKNDGAYRCDDDYYTPEPDHNLGKLADEAEAEYENNTSDFYCTDAHANMSLNHTIMLIEHLVRHKEKVIILRKLKELRKKIREKMNWSEYNYVGF